MELLFLFSLFVFSSYVFTSKNPVYGVISFVVVVTHIVIMLIALDLEFYAYILAIVYIGAIVVLFLFVIMMFYMRQNNVKQYLFAILSEYFLVGAVSALLIFFFYENSAGYVDYSLLISKNEDARLMSYFLFNDWAFLTLIITTIMLVIIIGAINLTIKSKIVKDQPLLVRNKVKNSIKKCI